MKKECRYCIHYNFDYDNEDYDKICYPCLTVLNISNFKPISKGADILLVPENEYNQLLNKLNKSQKEYNQLKSASDDTLATLGKENLELKEENEKLKKEIHSVAKKYMKY